MTNTNLKEIEKVLEEFNHDVDLIKKAIKNIQSRKCIQAKKKNTKNYESNMEEILKRERVLVEARQVLIIKPKFVTEYNQEDVEKLNLVETENALNSIRSKKTNSQQLTDGSYENALEIEQLLLNHKYSLKEAGNKHVTKLQVQTLIETIETTPDISLESIVLALNKLL